MSRNDSFRVPISGIPRALPSGGGGASVFDSDDAVKINRARMAHIDSLQLPLGGKSVLDVGCGIGHLARFFVERGCRITCVDGRAENIAVLRSRYPDMRAQVANVEIDSLAALGRFDIVFCYGLLYHLENPIAALRNIAQVCGQFLLLETIVADHSEPVLRLSDEPSETVNQALGGLGGRPSPAYVTMALTRAGFRYVYAPKQPPDHPDFQFQWKNDLEFSRHGHLLRCTFVASHQLLNNPNLSLVWEHIPPASAKTSSPSQAPSVHSISAGSLGWESAEDALKQAQALAYVRPLVPYPGWNFASDWDNPDLSFQMRRQVWQFFHDRRLEFPFAFNWYDGLRLNLYLGNDLSRGLFISGCSEPNEFAFLYAILAPGMVFIDAGANDGLYTLFAARRVGPEGMVLAFEPSAREFSRLEQNVDLNELKNVKRLRVALADHNGEQDLAVAGYEHEGQNTLGAFAYSGVELFRKERVPTRRLDDVVQEEKLSRIDIIKIDVEGAECRVIEGGREVINRFRPIVLFEAFDSALRKQSSSRNALLALVSSLQYELFTFQTGAVPGALPPDGGNMIGIPAENALVERFRGQEKEEPVWNSIVPVGDLGRPREDVQPYLSVVATARNDDHGGNLLGRMQIFVNGWIAQSRRHNLPSELIIVEWNPPPDRPRLREALRWPEDTGPCQVRFIEVPAELHSRYAHAEALPLYQMIAKNVGIRRARGEFVLATNIDILFSDELMEFLAKRCLKPGRMYRADRYDAMSNVPPDAPIDEQLEYCRTHLLRMNLREGTFPLTPDAQDALLKKAQFTPPLRSRLLVFWLRLQGLVERVATSGPAVTVTMPVPNQLKRAAAFYIEWGGLTGMLRSSVNWLIGRGRLRKRAAAKAFPGIEFLHTNGCGDFTLTARRHWFDLRGYPEFDLFSMNIDSVFCYAAHYGGAQEEVLPEPMRIYHIEHATGSGWTPEGQDQLFKRVAARGLGFVSSSDVIGWAEQMRQLNSTMIFNHEDWGLGEFDLVETAPSLDTNPSVQAASKPA